MLLAIPAEIVILILVLALIVLAIVVFIFFAAAKKVSDPEGEAAKAGQQDAKHISEKTE